jgi:N-acyl-D-aspartate/D-glutamate deacylase
MLDRILAGGTVYDGNGGKAIRADIGIKDGEIVAIGALDDREGPRLDACGLSIAPGFIDLHGHSDVSLIIEPSAASLTGQGVTSQVVGNCGTSAFPLPPGVPAAKFDPLGISKAWTSAAEYFEALASARPRVDVRSFVGLGTVRRLALGKNANRPATTGERDAIVAEVLEAMSAGAAGASLGLHFEPDLYADRAELESVCRAVAAADGVVAVHLRDYGALLSAAIDEALSLARVSGSRLHVSLLHAFGRPSWRSLPQVLDRLDDAREQGIDVTCEFLLWPTVGAWDGWRAVLEPGAYDWASPDWAMLRRLAVDRDTRMDLAATLEERRRRPKSGFSEEYLCFSDWRDISLEALPPDSAFGAFLGWSITAIGEELDVPEADVLLDLLADRPEATMLLHRTLSEEDVAACVSWPHAFLGLDAVATRRSRLGQPWNTMQIHPRHFGATARLFDEFVRRRRLLSPGAAITRLTRGPASVVGWADRGLVSVGMRADLVVLDLDHFAPTGTWTDTAAPVSGLQHVIAAGIDVYPEEPQEVHPTMDSANGGNRR